MIKVSLYVDSDLPVRSSHFSLVEIFPATQGSFDLSKCPFLEVEGGISAIIKFYTEMRDPIH